MGYGVFGALEFTLITTHFVEKVIDEHVLVCIVGNVGFGLCD